MKSNALYIVSFAAMIAFSSCGGSKNAEMEKLKTANAALQEELDSRSKSVESLLSGLEMVQADLRDISIREGLLEGKTVSEEELARSPQEQIMEDIGLVDGLIRKNRDRIEALELTVRKSDGKLYEFERVVGNLKLDILDKENDLMAFKENLIELEENFATLLDDYQAQSLLAGMQDQALHRAYFAFGSKSELLEGGVIQKTGGVIGVGKTWELKDDFNKDYFTEVDIRSVDRIPLSTQKVELLSQHPEDSYELIIEDKIVKELRITDSDRFWSGSRYLAMMVE